MENVMVSVMLIRSVLFRVLLWKMEKLCRRGIWAVRCQTSVKKLAKSKYGHYLGSKFLHVNEGVKKYSFRSPLDLSRDVL